MLSTNPQITKFHREITLLILTKRRTKSISQEDIAAYLNVDPSFIANIERYEKKYNLDHINRLAKLFDCSPRELIPAKYIDEDL